MSHQDWVKPYTRSLGFQLGGDSSEGEGREGDLLVLLNAYSEPITYRLPDGSHADWMVLLNTASTTKIHHDRRAEAVLECIVQPHSLVVLAQTSAARGKSRDKDPDQ